MKPFSLPAGWEIKLFGQCIQKVKYTEKQPTKSFLPEGKFPIVSQEKELISGYSNNQNAVFSVKNPVVIFGDHTKVVKYIDFDFVIGADGVKILQPIEEINAKYFYYYLSHLHLRDLGYARHYKLLKECIVIYPSLPEQKRIVEKLDKIFAAIDKAKSQTAKNLQNAKDVFSSYLNNIFNHPTHNWEEKTLGEVCEILAGQSPESRFYNSNQNGLPFYQGKKEFSDKYIRPAIIWTTKTTKVALKDDILMSVRAPVGPVNYAVEKCCIGRGLAAIRIKKDLNNDFLFYFLQSIEFRIAGHHGTVFNSISRKEIQKINIRFPAFPEQKLIVEKLDILQSKTQELEKIYTQKLADLEELKQSVLQQAFSGKL